MRRVLVFFDWKAGWWVTRADARTGVDEVLREGLQAYAAKQAAILKNMARRFSDLWYGRHVANGLVPEWPDEYVIGHSTDEPMDTSNTVGDDLEDLEDDIYDDIMFDFV
jgi:hypothetical protein